MNRIERAIELMRAHRDEPMPVSRIAEKVGMSPFYFSRVFTATEGMGPARYQRQIRLETAARALVERPLLPLAEIALDAGFESQQTFTRAFSAAFGISPANYRRTGTAERRHFRPLVTPQLEAEARSLPPRRFVGFSAPILDDESDGPRQAWARLQPLLPVAGQVRGDSYGICIARPGGYRYMAAILLDENAEVPADMEVLAVPAQAYLAIRQKMPADDFMNHFQAGLHAIWTDVVPSSGRQPSGGPDFEIYPDDLIAGQTSGWLTHLIAIEKP